MDASTLLTGVFAARKGLARPIGSLAAGKQSSMVLIKGNPSAAIDDIRNVVTVFKEWVGYDPAKRLEAVRGAPGIR